MIPVLFHLGPLTVYSFGLMMALGFLAADYVIRLECVRRGFDPDYSSSIVIAAAVMGLMDRGCTRFSTTCRLTLPIPRR